VVPNVELAEKVDTSDEWIVERTGIRQRIWRVRGNHQFAGHGGGASRRWKRRG
jgi:3-oxoacyl-[acyl-carrier-protein] synthase III